MRTYLLSLFLLASALLVGQTALATTVFSDITGTNVTFTGMQETSTFGDPEPACCFNAPTGSGDSLLFFPTAFSASSAGGGVDQTGSQFQAMITANTALDVINKINITEFGDAIMAGSGTAGTGVFASMAGFVTVTETTAGVLGTPVVIGWTGDFTPTNDVTPNPFDLLLDLTTHPGTTLWSGSVSIDIEAALIAAGVFDQATKVTLSYDNNLFAFSEAGSSALVQKKVVDGPAVIIEVIPEPATGVLLAGGLIALGLRGRRVRS